MPSSVTGNHRWRNNRELWDRRGRYRRGERGRDRSMAASEARNPRKRDLGELGDLRWARLHG